MRNALVRFILVGVACAALPGVAVSKSVASRSHSTYVRMVAGASVSRVDVPERSGVIRLLRVVAPAGTRIKVTGAIPGVAGVSVSLPLKSRAAAPETCSGHGGVVACTVAVEACPMPQATWHFQLRKTSGPAGRVRVDFVVGPKRSTSP
jgi:hypothetical protein